MQQFPLSEYSADRITMSIRKKSGDLLIQNELADPTELPENEEGKKKEGVRFILNTTAAPRYSLGLKFLKRSAICVRVILPHIATRSSFLFILLLLGSVIQQYVIYHVGLIPSRFFKVLGAKDKSSFKSTILLALYFIGTIALANSAVKYISGQLYVKWREHLTSFLQNRYFYKETFYHVNTVDENIDNADQRITQDVDKFCLQLSDISSKLLISPFTIAYYSYKCFTNTGWYGPVSIYVYFIVGSLINRIIMSPIVGLVVRQEKYEGNFRFKHVNVRSNSESISFLQGCDKEHKSLRQTFEQLLQVQLKIVNLEFWLNLSVNLFDYLGSVLSYFVIAIPIFAGSYENLTSVQLSALISQNAFVSMYLINCFSTLMDLSGKITDIAGYTHRIGELIEALSLYNDLCTKKSYRFESKMSDLRETNGKKMVIYDLKDVSYSAIGSESLLVKNLNLTIMTGKNVLVMGETGSGKSSLLRILRNLWSPCSGNLDCFLPLQPNGIFFLPQKFLLTHGSLFDQVRYPLSCDGKDEIDVEKDNAKIKQCIEDVGLKSLLERTERFEPSTNREWDNILSPGEMQRLSFARVFYHRPKLAVLDEATSALGKIEEDCFYTYCRQLNISFISVGHHDSLKKYHDSILTLKGEGCWEFSELNDDS